jgi:hypothetical protein
MYQSLIWAVYLGDHACGLRTALDAKDMERAADALVDRMRRNAELDGDFLRRQMLVDEQKGIQLPRAQTRHSIGDGRIRLIGG